MPDSVSVPITRRTLMVGSLRAELPGCQNDPSEILPGVGDRVDGTARLGACLARDQRPDVHDPLALRTGYASPVVRVGGVGQVLVLAELIDAGRAQMAHPHALLPGPEHLLDGHLLGPGHDVIDHRAGV